MVGGSNLVLAGIMATIYAGNPRKPVTLIGKVHTVVLMMGEPLLLFGEAPFLPNYQSWHITAFSVLNHKSGRTHRGSS